MTKPDKSLVVIDVSQFHNSPCDSHRDVVDRSLRYFKGSPGKGSIYENRGPIDIVAHTNVHSARSPRDRRLTSRYCVIVRKSLM